MFDALKNLGNIRELMTKAQEMQQQMKQLQDEMGRRTVNADAGGGMVTATVNTAKGKVVIELFPKEAPKTVNNFVFLAREKFYDGTIFHRIIPNFMIQGGDPTGTGMGGPGYQFENENKDSQRKFGAGTVAMANAGPDTNGSQFFINDADSPWLTADKYTIFGHVKDGMDTVKAIVNAPKGANDRPNDPVKIDSIQ